MAPETKISLIAALSSRDHGIGMQGKLLWNIPEDLKRFKKLTDGHPVIMGRKTWESLPEKFRPLPNRTNIIITRNPSYKALGGTVSRSLEDALAIAAEAPESSEIFIIGGGEIYTEALPLVSRLYLTLVDVAILADAFFPSYETEFQKIIETISHPENVPAFSWVTLER